MAPHQQFFEIFEKVEFLHDHEKLDIGSVTVIFSERSSFRKASNFYSLPYLKLFIFCHKRIWLNLLYLGNHEDLGNGVGDFFGP